jgi:predicted nucleotidyltransferase
VRLVADRDDGGQTGRSLGHNEVEPMNLTLEFGKMNVDGMALAEVCRRYSVKELSLFGSAARGEMRPESDVDIMVEFEPDARVGLIKFESFAEELEALTGRTVDLVTKGGLKPWVRPAVLKDARVIYAA